MKPRKSWTERFEDAKPHVVKPVPINIAGMRVGQIMLVPSPKIVADFIRKIPRGQAIDVPTLRQRLARRYRAEVTCPITMGFHLRTVAEAAYEAFAKGCALKDITPFWRVLDFHTPTIKKLSFDSQFVALQREREGLPL